MRLAQCISFAVTANKRIGLKAIHLITLLSVGATVGLIASVHIFIGKRSLITNSAKLSQSMGSLSEGKAKETDLAASVMKSQGRGALISAVGDLVFAGTDRAWIQNYRGELLLTQDAGKSWTPIGGEVAKRFDAFTMRDGYRGWAADHEGKIWQTDDGGYNWNLISLLKRQDPEEYYRGALQILFTDDSKGWVLDTFAVWRTQDGGLSWHEVDELSYGDNLTDRVRKMYFLDSKLGWAICEGGLILQTDDGGKTWRSGVSNAHFDEYTNISALHFLDVNQGWIAASDALAPYPENVVLATADGNNWHRQKEISGRVSINDIFFLDYETGWMAGSRRYSEAGVESGILFQTQDGGRTWQRVKTVPDTDVLKSIRFTSADEGWLTTDYSVYRTHDGGKRWSAVLSYPEIKHRNLQVLGLEESNGEILLYEGDQVRREK